MKRSAPLKRTPVRRKRAGKRRGPLGIAPEEWRNPLYLHFLRYMGYCVACCPMSWKLGAARPRPAIIDGVEMDPAHGPCNGMASKGPDAGALPLCRGHHDEQHSIGWPAFEEAYGFNRSEVAALWWNAFRELS